MVEEEEEEKEEAEAEAEIYLAADKKAQALLKSYWNYFNFELKATELWILCSPFFLPASISLSFQLPPLHLHPNSLHSAPKYQATVSLHLGCW